MAAAYDPSRTDWAEEKGYAIGRSKAEGVSRYAVIAGAAQRADLKKSSMRWRASRQRSCARSGADWRQQGLRPFHSSYCGASSPRDCRNAGMAGFRRWSRANWLELRVVRKGLSLPAGL